MRFKFPFFWFTKSKLTFFLKIYQWRKEYKRNLKCDAYSLFPVNDLTLVLVLELVPLSYLFFHVLVSKRSWIAGSHQFCYKHCELALFLICFWWPPARHKEYKRNFKFDFRTFFRLSDFTIISPLALESSLCHCGILCTAVFLFSFFFASKRSWIAKRDKFAVYALNSFCFKFVL